MEALGTFDATALAKLPGTINAMSDDQVALVSQYYFLTRSKAEQDAYIYALEQQGSTAAQLAAANAQIADLMATMNQEIAACYAQLAVLPQPVVYCTQVCYASVPGWCCHVGCFVPEWCFNNDCYVGPCLKLGWSGPWAGPICKVFFDHHSHFWFGYSKFALAAHINHSLTLAKLHVAELRKGDWHGTLAHDRFVHHAAGVVHTPVVHTPLVHEPIVKTHVPTPTHTDAHKSEVDAHKSVVDAHKLEVHEPKPKIEAKHVSASHEHSSKPAAAYARRSRRTRTDRRIRAIRATHRHMRGMSAGTSVEPPRDLTTTYERPCREGDESRPLAVWELLGRLTAAIGRQDGHAWAA